MAIPLLVVLASACGSVTLARERDGAADRAELAAARAPEVDSRAVTIGYSVEHRPITAVLLGDPRARRPLLIVGCIHGNEPAGIAIARRLIRDAPDSVPAMWIVPDINPDGVAAGTRQNAHGVDLNRNFPYEWNPVYGPGDLFYQGPRPLSEPESRAIYDLIRRVNPGVTIWFHQHQDLVDLSGGNPRLEMRFAALVGLPVRRLARYGGSATGWQNHAIPSSTAFVVELPGGSLSSSANARYARGVIALARSVERSRLDVW